MSGTVKCPACAGSGMLQSQIESGEKVCPTCVGYGRVADFDPWSNRIEHRHSFDTRTRVFPEKPPAERTREQDEIAALRVHIAKIESENVRLLAMLRDSHERVKAFEAERQAILDLPHEHPLMSDKVTTHEGPSLYTAAEALAIYRANAERRKSALARTVMTDEERAAFVGDSRPT